MFVNYHENVLNVISSIRKYFGLESSYESDERFDEILNKKKYEHIILCLIDGMGSRLLEKKLPKDSFLRSHMAYETYTVFPPTTTAATTSILNGKAPNENAWLGWMQYIKELDDTIVPFFGSSYYGDKKYGSDYMYKLLPVKNITQELNENGIKANEIYPAFRENGCKSVEEFVSRLKEETYSDNKFTYAYWDEFDSLMHKNGVTDNSVDEYLRKLDELFASKLNDINENSLIVMIADHGQVDIAENINFYDTKLKDYLIRPLANEGRSSAFYVKDEYKEVFRKEFIELFENDFVLLSHEDVLKTHLFGEKENHSRFEEFIGDFMAIAKGNKQFIYKEPDNDDGFRMKGSHAGCHEDELYIPIILIEK